MDFKLFLFHLLFIAGTYLVGVLTGYRFHEKVATLLKRLFKNND